MTPCLEVVYASRSLLPRSPAIDEVMTMEPLVPVAWNCRNAARTPRNGPRRFTAMTVSHSAASTSTSGATDPAMPALRKWKSTVPNRSTAAVMYLFTPSSADTSAPTPTAGVDSRSATSVAAAPSRSTATTWTPSSARRVAAARPNPPAAPVTTATLPLNPFMLMRSARFRYSSSQEWRCRNSGRSPWGSCPGWRAGVPRQESGRL
ncbi:Uncharacterised protein [Mycobacteroides abscessus subsp. abscessus]|nr:Uncharacterised protein [Mycobacteroides abscessus subsp. abscessus]